MSKVKFTKNELKAQRDALRRYKRYLPTLELKKMQLQIEVRKIDHLIAEQKKEEKRIWDDDLDAWICLFAEDIDIGFYIRVKEVKCSIGNIAGVSIPVFDKVEYERNPVDFYATPPWVDDGIDVLERLIKLRIEMNIYERQKELLSDELRVTSQRVNLFEKVKIPECIENIRKIRIYLADEQTAAVVRAKMAKRKFQNVRTGA
ncbi:V-type ATP synthase subunit D [Candidatus Kuenenia stuttgartiensis]|jgi:V/A-type H+-transporting ATPase subunit D|uniref:V-type ATP synthase subunit D n=1 Tax=Kuenenia stuttgartiensis TaxID=174633 RepID=Q1Q3P2_KUEST|nr:MULTISPECIES: V-type ATP synthase subunit D [Kuenenia]MBE7447279.1 V-type ATP synthase subunit D [Planctomycetia bacterium]MBE7546891.1 V-type ATP synthase subunit D [Planctomycetia bacterium]MBW7943282.1 V-type ATP synthase subunit D [Candidatus Kuenenia stuttgartiensis]MBZ0192089.1 V-type ATP synthase subunit D [Candidatus Kuenenia stuttgartiensis]MCL4728599.1 V-type ATP synthase subunit D [Candidatus Kuenenia stuttgartiensis]